jgi:outer membrane scaffolding protein for murein synthesis (MipA/OmpV family)
MRDANATALLALMAAGFLALSSSSAAAGGTAAPGAGTPTTAAPTTGTPSTGAPPDMPATGASADKTDDAKKKDSDWDISIGLGAAVAPDYEGSNNYEISPVPDLEISWRDRVTLSGTSLSVAAISTSHVKAGPTASYEFGRDHDENKALKHLGNVGDSVELGGFITTTFDNWSVDLRLAQDVANGHGGAIGQLSTSYTLPISEKLSVTATASSSWASRHYMRSYFGISDRQAAKSGYDQYDAGAGIKDIGLAVDGTYSFDEHWALEMNIAYSRLVGDAADSPIVKDAGSPNQFSAMLGIAYTF